MAEEKNPSAEQTEAGVTIGVSKEDLERAFAGPAIFSNRVFVTLSAGGVRFAFTEQSTDVPPQFRAAVMMPYPDAIQLMELLERLLSPVQAQIAAAEQKGEQGGSGPNG